jgi:hypothetical protein
MTQQQGQDPHAVNLAWKLAADLGSTASGDLLDSYDSERRPNAAALLAFTEQLTGFAELRDPATMRLRDETLHAAAQLSTAGRNRISAVRTARSAQSTSLGRGCVRRSTATSCRSTSNSAFLESDDRPSRDQPQVRPTIGTPQGVPSAVATLNGAERRVAGPTLERVARAVQAAAAQFLR